MHLFKIITLLAVAVHCVQAVAERKLLRKGYDSGLDLSTLTGSTADTTTAALSSITSLLPTGSGTSGILPSTDSLSSRIVGTGLGGLTSLTSGNTFPSLSSLSSMTSMRSLPSGSTGTGTGISSLANLVNTPSTSNSLLSSAPETTESNTTTDSITQAASK